MNSDHTVNLTPSNYILLQQLADDNEETINEVIVKLIKQQHKTVDLTTGLDTIPSNFNKCCEFDFLDGN